MTQPGSNTGDQQGQGTGTGTEPDSTAQGQGQGAGTAAPPDTSQSGSWSADEWRAFAQEVGLSPTQLKQRLANGKDWEKRAKQNVDRAREAQTLEQQLDQMRKDMADRDLRDLARSQRTATTELRAQLVGLGLSDADAREAVELIDADKLLKDGEPDEKAIEKIARSLGKVTGRATPDRDQGAGGQNGSTGPQSMSSWVQSRVQEARRR